MSALQPNSSDPIPNRFNDLRDILIDAYNLATDIPDMIDVHNDNALQIITSCLLIKVLNTTKAILLLIESNLLSEVHVLLRHQMEEIFVLRACEHDEAFLFEYINSDHKYRLRLGNVISNNQNHFNGSEGFNLQKIEKLKHNLKTIVDEQGIKDFLVEDLAKKAKLEVLYNTAYRLFSNVAHVGVRSLDDYLLLDNKGEIEELNIYPYQEDIAKLYITAIELILIALKSINSIFQINLENKVQTLDEHFNLCADTHLKPTQSNKN